jgi:hypothetical protein
MYRGTPDLVKIGQKYRALYMKTLVLLYCWQHHWIFCSPTKLLLYNCNTQRFYIVDSYLWVDSMKRTHCCALPWQQWLCERITVLLRTCIAFFVPHSFWYTIHSFIIPWFDDVWWEQVRASFNEQRMNKQRETFWVTVHTLCVQTCDTGEWRTARLQYVCVINLFVGGRSCNVRARAYVRACVCVFRSLVLLVLKSDEEEVERFSNYRLT